MTDPISDQQLRENHQFVMAFETLRKRHGEREMSDPALRDIAQARGVDFEDLRIARHLRNALAHGETVNRTTLATHLRLLTEILMPGPDPSTQSGSARSASSEVHAYRIHAWQDPRLEQEMLANGFISVGGSEIGDLTDVEDPELIRDLLTTSMPDRSPRATALYVGYWRRFLWDAQLGDLVVLPTRDRRVAIGEFTGPYLYVEGPEPRARHRRPVYWGTTGIDRDRFSPALTKILNSQHTVMDVPVALVPELRAASST